MNIFSRRPLFLALALFIMSNALCVFMQGRIKLYFAFAAAVFAGVLFVAFLLCLFTHKPFGITLFNAFLCAVFCTVAFASSYLFFDEKLGKLELLSDTVSIEGEVTDCSFSASYQTEYILNVRTVNGEKRRFTVLAVFAGEVNLKKGDVISAKASLLPFSEDVYGFNERNYYISNGILMSADITDCTVLYNDHTLLKYGFSDLSDRVSNRIDDFYGGDTAALLKALIVGDKSDLADTIKRDFRRLGISHILSISGTHFTTLLGMLSLLLAHLGINKKIVYFLLIPTAVIYMGITGFSPTVCRAGIMAILAYFGFLCGRTRDSYTALFIAVSAIFLIHPYAVLGVGLWLSFTATLAIIVFVDCLGRFPFKVKHRVATLFTSVLMRLLITVVVFFATLPLIAVFFGEVSIISPLSNLIIVPLFELFLYIAPFSILLGGLAPVSFITDRAASCIINFSTAFADRDGLLVSVRMNFVVYISAISLFIAFILVSVRLKRKWLILFPFVLGICAVAVTVSSFMSIQEKQTSLAYFTVSKSDGLVITDKNRSLFIDISTGASAVTREAEYIAELQYCPEIYGYMITHYHANHISSFRKLSGRTRISRIYLPPAQSENDENYMQKICETAQERNIEIVYYDFDGATDFGDVAVTVFQPQKITRSTHRSISLALTMRDTDILYLGSSFNEGETDFSDECENAEYIIFGQHSPIAKNVFSVNTLAKTVYGNESIAALSECSDTNSTVISANSYEIILKLN